MLNKLSSFFRFRYLLYFFSLIAGWPCVFYLMGWLPHYTINYVILFILTFGYVFWGKNTFIIPKPIAILIGLQCMVWCIYFIIHGFDTSYLTRVFMLCVTSLILAIQLKSPRLEFIKAYNFWITFQVVVGAIGFVLVLGGILRPFFEFQEMDMRTGYFFGLFTSNAYSDGFIRNAGFFDEPGALAFWGMIALLMNKLYVDNHKIELALIFGLISTLSMAYFIQIVLYLWLFYKGKRLKIVFPVLLFIATLKGVASFNDRIDQAIFGRFEYNEKKGTLAGDNRSDLMDVCWDIFKTAPIIGQGGQHLIEISKEKQLFVGANAYMTLACDGIIGQLIIWSPFFFLYSLRKYSRKYGWAFWILIIGFLQRPYDCNQLLFPLVSFTLIMHAYLNVQSSKQNIKYARP